MNRSQLTGTCLLILILSLCLGISPALGEVPAETRSLLEAEESAVQGVGLAREEEVKWETEEEMLAEAVLSTTFNPSIHHRRPVRQVADHLGFGVFSDFFSNYVWRGLLSSQGAVWQPSLTVEYYGVGFNVWANLPMTNEPNQGQFNEIDLTLYYNKNYKKINFHTWFILDFYPNGNPTSLDFGTKSLEWDLHISRPLGPVVVFTDFAIRIVSAPASVYWDVGVGYARTLPLKFSVELSSLFALANGKFTKAHVAAVGTVPYLFEASLAFPWNPVRGFTVTPRMYISTLLADSLRRASSDPTILWGGVSFGYELGALR